MKLQIAIIVAALAAQTFMLNSAYKRGLAEARVSAAEAQKEAAERINATLSREFAAYQQQLIELKETSHAEMQKIAEQYKNLPACHTVDGIGLLNEAIRARFGNTKSSP